MLLRFQGNSPPDNTEGKCRIRDSGRLGLPAESRRLVRAEALGKAKKM
jgi:hypothetical protein